MRVLESVWSGFRTHQVYRTDATAVARSSLHWLATLLTGGLGRHNPRSLFDNRPLRQLLAERLPFERIQRHIDSGILHAVSVTVSSYRSGRSVSFYQGNDAVRTWHRARRESRCAQLGVEHLMASAAVPIVFPAIDVNGEYFGDGALRQMMPLSPAVHLGATRLLVVGVRDERPPPPEKLLPQDAPPSIGHIAGYMLDTLFMDGLYSDLERITRINMLLDMTPRDRLRGPLAHVRRVETLVVVPSSDVRDLASSNSAQMPLAVRMLLRGLGAYGRGGGQLLSYMLFEQRFTRALIQLGFEDAMAQREHILALLRGDPMPAIDAPARLVRDLSGQEKSA